MACNLISGYVYQDLNNDGLMQPGEPPIANSTISLLDSSGNTVATTTSDVNGFYQFDKDPRVNTAEQTVTKTYTIEDSRTNWSQNFTLERFDSSLGTLTGIDIVHSGTVRTSFGAENFSSLLPGTVSLTGNLDAALTLTGPSVNSTLTISGSTFQYSFTPTVYDGTLDFGGTSGQSFNETTTRTSTTSLTTPAELASYQSAPLTVSFDAAAKATSSVTGTGNMVTLAQTFASTDVTVVYHYTPSNCLAPGNYTVVQTTQPSGFLDGQETAGNVTPIPNSAGGPDSIPVTLDGTHDSVQNNFGEILAGSIHGVKLLDTTGNGRSADDTGLAGVTIKLYQDNGNGVFDQADTLIRTANTADNTGAYSFDGLPQGVTYFVTEGSTPGYVRTFPETSSSYKVDLSSSTDPNSYDFVNAEVCDTDILKCISYLVTHNGVTTSYSGLRGHVESGDTVQVQFTYNGHVDHDFSLVSYTAPGSSFKASDAYLQQILQSTTISLKASDYGKRFKTDPVVVPNCFFQVDFVCGLPIDQFGPAGSNIFYTPQGRLFSADNGGCQSCDTSSLSGYVYVDSDNDGRKDSGESGIKDVTVRLYDASGTNLLQTTKTSSSGYYKFDGLGAGVYVIRESQPGSYDDGKDTIGSQGGSASANDVLTTAFVNTNTSGTNNNFGERDDSDDGGCLVKGDTETIGYWKCGSGQDLIKSVNGGSNSKSLGNWLANTFPRLFGSDSDYNLKSKKNSDVASYYRSVYYDDKTFAQIFATALSVYMTDSDLAGNAAADEGFNVSKSGTGAKSYNVGSDGSDIGLSNNKSYTVMDLLKQANSAFGTRGTSRDSFCDVFKGINEKGD